LTSTIFSVILTTTVVVVYCKKTTSPLALSLNYTAWILLAILQSFGVIGIAIVAAMFSVFSVYIASLLSSFANLPSDNQAALNSALSIVCSPSSSLHMPPLILSV